MMSVLLGRFFRAWPIALAATVFSQPVAAAVELPPWWWNQGSYGLSATTEYFRTTANYDETRGSFQRLPNDNTFSTFETKLRARYGLTSRWSLFTGFGFAQVRAVDPLNEKTNSAVTDVFAGADFLLPLKWIRLVPEIQAGYPITAIDTKSTNPLTSEGVGYVRATLFARKVFKHLELFGHGGLYVPAEGLAKRFEYGTGLDVRLGSSISVGGGIEGYETAMPDELSLAERSKVTSAADAGSYRFYAYNPALLEAQAWIRFQPDRSLLIRAGYGKTLNGIRSAEGQSFLLTVSFNIPGRHRGSTASRTRHKREQDLKVFDETRVESEPSDSFEADDTVEESNRDVLDDTEQLLENK